MLDLLDLSIQSHLIEPAPWFSVAASRTISARHAVHRMLDIPTHIIVQPASTSVPQPTPGKPAIARRASGVYGTGYALAIAE